MRNMKMALVVLAVLAMASTSFAGWSITVVRMDDGTAAYQAGLETYMVRTQGANAFENLMIAGGVHQLTKEVDDGFGNVDIQKTLYDNVAPLVAGAPALYHNTDTHFEISNSTDYLAVGSGSVDESNDHSNPAAMTLAANWFAGLGSFGGDMAFALKGSAAEAALAGPIDLLQVVIPVGTKVVLTGTAIDFYAGETPVAIREVIGVPEPGTIALLIAGALCLVVVRLRK